MEHYSDIKRNIAVIQATAHTNLENIMLSERTQKQKATYIAWLYLNEMSVTTESIGTKSGCQRWDEGWLRESGVTANRYEVYLGGGGVENVLELGSDDSCTILWLY